MKLYDVDDYILNHIEDFDIDSFEFRREDNYIVYLYNLAYIFPEYNIICYEGSYFDTINHQADFFITSVFENGEYMYCEESEIIPTLYRYFEITDRDVDLLNLECEIKEDYKFL